MLLLSEKKEIFRQSLVFCPTLPNILPNPRCHLCMKRLRFLLLLSPLAALADSQPALTIYNQNFAVVRETLSLDLKKGVNAITFTGITRKMEPDSVILRDLSGKTSLQILEQNYRNDPVSEETLLKHYEGQTIDFQRSDEDGNVKTVSGKIIRANLPFEQERDKQDPLIEVDGKLRFGLPGRPLFPALADDSVLHPSLQWQLLADQAGKMEAELAYITGGLSWKADYNLVAPENGDRVTFIGWITFENKSGKTFKDAKIKLMAGDVHRVPPQAPEMAVTRWHSMAKMDASVVTEKTFDEYHLYTLERPTTLRDRETKQVEFLHAEDVQSKRIYVYDGLNIQHLRLHPVEFLRSNEGIGQESSTKVAIMREFRNTKDNHLGIPLPKGKIRFYRQDSDRRLEFLGENEIDHTPKNETVRVFTGNAFDIVGERKRTHFTRNDDRKVFTESFEIKVRNRKNEPVEVQIVEHLFRWYNWEITEKSDPFTRVSAQRIEFPVKIAPDSEKTVTYTVRYSWGGDSGH